LPMFFYVVDFYTVRANLALFSEVINRTLFSFCSVDFQR